MKHEWEWKPVTDCGNGEDYHMNVCKVCGQTWHLEGNHYELKRIRGGVYNSKEIDLMCKHSILPNDIIHIYNEGGCIGFNPGTEYITKKWINFYIFDNGTVGELQARFGGYEWLRYPHHGGGEKRTFWTQERFEKEYGKFIAAKFNHDGEMIIEIVTETHIVFALGYQDWEYLKTIQKDPEWLINA